MKINKNEQGFIVSVTAIIIVLILGIFVLYFSSSISLNVTSATNTYSSSQARWSAYSGVEDILMKLSSTGLNDLAGTYPFYNGGIIIDTTTIDAVNQILQITSKGTHSNSNRIFSLEVQYTDGDGPFYYKETFDEGDSNFVYQPIANEDGDSTYWGFSCDGDAGFEPTYIFLNGDGSCYFYGVPQVHPGEVLIDGIEIYEYGDLMVSVDLAAGVDVHPETGGQSIFHEGDSLQLLINDYTIEAWIGPSDPGGPLYPRVGNATRSLTPDYYEYTFNLTQIFGEIYENYEEDEFDFEIEATVGDLNKYIGFDNIRFWEFEGGGGSWEIVDGSYTEI